MRKRFMQLTLLMATSLVIAGCAGRYEDFYTPAPGVTPELIAANRVSPAPEEPLIERSEFGDIKQIIADYYKRGFVSIGSSMFNSGEGASEHQALAQGSAVGADLVLVFYPRYTDSVTSSVPITTPTTSTSYATGSATAYGPGGPVTAYGNVLTTTHGTNTTYVPMTVNRSDYGAVFFVKYRNKFGVSVRNLNDLERQALQTNQGVAVEVIVDDSPAFRADILPGDFIVSIDNEKVANHEGFSRLIDAHSGQAITVTLVRQGQVLVKKVTLGS